MDYSIAWSVWERHQSGLSIIQSLEVLQSTASSLPAHALKAEVRAGTPDKLSQGSAWESGGNSQFISKNRTLRKKSHSQVSLPMAFTEKSSYTRTNVIAPQSPLSQIHHLHCSFCVPFNWQNISPNQAYKNPAWLWCSDFRDEGRWGFLHQFFPRLSCLPSHMEKAIFLSNCFARDAGSLLPLQPSPAMAGPCTMSCREGRTSPILRFCPDAPSSPAGSPEMKIVLSIPFPSSLPWRQGLTRVLGSKSVCKIVQAQLSNGFEGQASQNSYSTNALGRIL